MLQSLHPQSFRDFGTILKSSQSPARYATEQSISLLPDRTVVYQTAADTWLSMEKGSAALSVSTDGKDFRDFYLDKPVRLHGGVWFSLVALEAVATLRLSAFSVPRLLSTRTRSHHFEIRPGFRVATLYSVLYQEREQGFLFPGESHTMTELVYVDRGSLHSVADGAELLLEQGDMALYAPGQWHMQYADVGVAPRFVTIAFDTEGGDLSPLWNRKLSADPVLRELMRQILREQETMASYATDLLLALLQLLLLTLLRQAQLPREERQAVNSVPGENAVIQAAQQYITAHIREKLSVPVVARQAQVSASYLTALFHKHLQISPGEYIRRIKLQESKQLIREGDLNFTQIAEALQYSTVHHFSRQFKEKFGITPTEYAKSVR